eukprot:5683252-Amphidinium_carterae.1
MIAYAMLQEVDLNSATSYKERRSDQIRFLIVCYIRGSNLPNKRPETLNKSYRNFISLGGRLHS